MPTVLETSLVRTLNTCGGRLRIDGTRMTVNQIVTLHKLGLTAEQIVERYPHLSIGAIYAALAWYHENRVGLDAELAAEAEADALAESEFKTQSWA